VGKKLSDLTTRKVILIVLSMLLTAPLFVVTTFKPNPDGAAIGLEMIAANQVGTDGFNLAFENYIELYYYNRKSLILVSAKNVIWESAINPNNLRTNEKEFVVAVNFEGDENVIAVLDIRETAVLEAILSIFQTIFVCIVLATGAMVF